MTRRILIFFVGIISLLILIPLFYYSNIYRTNIIEFTEINIDNISKIEIDIMDYDKPMEEFVVNDKEEINQIMNVINKFTLRRNIFREKQRGLGFSTTYYYFPNGKEEPSKRTTIIVYEGERLIDITISFGKYMNIYIDRRNPYDFEIFKDVLDINDIRNIAD